MKFECMQEGCTGFCREETPVNRNVGFPVGLLDMGATLARTKRTHPWEETKPQYRMIG